MRMREKAGRQNGLNGLNGLNELNELNALNAAVREYAGKGELQKCERLVAEAMKKYPHAAVPHNLYGILLEKQGEHPLAMRHFRAAYALEPAFLPARQNLENFGTFYSNGKYAYEDSDCRKTAAGEEACQGHNAAM